MPAGYNFDAESIARIARSVLQTERAPQNERARQRHFHTPSVPERWYRCRNDDAAELPASGVVEVDSEQEVGGELIYVVKKIGTTWPARVAVLGNEPVAGGKTGAITFDPTFVLCDAAATPGPKECWGIKPNETKLFKGYPGFRSLGKSTGETPRALMRQAWPEILWAKAASGIPARSGSTPGSATVTVYTLASGSLASTGFSVTAHNASGAAVVADKFLHIVQIEDDWASNYEDCDA